MMYCHLSPVAAQDCDNLSLAFDGDEDYITLSPLPASFSTNPVFTAETWFYANTPGGTNCLNGIRRLLSFEGGSTAATYSLLDIGLCNSGELHYAYRWGAGSVAVVTQISGTIVTNACHHLAASYTANTLRIYLDGVLLNTFAIPAVVAFEFNTFRVGHSSAGITGEDWDGLADEIRLWNSVRSLQEIKDYKDCTLSGAWPSLVAYWTLDQAGILAAGNNTNIPNLSATDVSGNGNHGVFSTGANAWAFNGTGSNFVCNGCDTKYMVDISSIPDPFPVSYISICSGDPVHFCVMQNGAPVGSIPGATVSWEYLDGGILPWQPVPNSNGIFSGFCFFVPPGEIDVSSECGSSATGTIARKYRARITTTNQSAQSCTFTTAESSLDICCRLAGATVQAVVQAPLPFNTTLCEDPGVPVSIDVSVSGLSFLNNLTIQWCLNGQPVTGVGNVTSFTYNGPVVAPQMCFEAKIQNCVCPLVHPSFCIPVDKKPVCGLIDGMDPIDLFPTATPYEYLMCAGTDGIVGMFDLNDFKNCNPVWQFHLDTDGPGIWTDLGSSNQYQNTNTLPQFAPPGSPYLWQSNTTCISYRVQCRPLTYPNSGCDPCLSNEVKICLLPKPPVPTITGNTQFCYGSNNLLSVGNPGPYNYDWFLNGIGPVGTGPTFTATQGGCYTVVATAGCEKVASAPYCIEACRIVIPQILCPVDNPCACGGLPMTVSACNAYDTCTGTTLSFVWSTSNVGGGPGTPTGPNGCEFMHIPDAAGTIYTVVVTNNLGCSATAMIEIDPCP